MKTGAETDSPDPALCIWPIAVDAAFEMIGDGCSDEGLYDFMPCCLPVEVAATLE